MLKTVSPYGFFVITGALALLASVMLATPGCSGPPSPTPCDLFSTAQDAVAHRRGFAERWGLVALDLGSSAYVRDHQPAYELAGVLHTPGVLIDRKSCRVCRVDGYATFLEGEHPVLLTTPPVERGARSDAAEALVPSSSSASGSGSM